MYIKWYPFYYGQLKSSSHCKFEPFRENQAITRDPGHREKLQPMSKKTHLKELTANVVDPYM